MRLLDSLAPYWSTIGTVATGSGTVFAFLWRKWLRYRVAEWKRAYRNAMNVHEVKTSLDSLHQQITTIAASLQPNGGSSIADGVNRIERQLNLHHRITLALFEVSRQAIWRSDADGLCILASQELIQIVGGDPTGNNWLKFVAEEDRHRVRQEWMQAVEDQRGFTSQYRFRHHDGRVVKVQAEAVPVFIEDQKAGRIFEGFVGGLRLMDQ